MRVYKYRSLQNFQRVYDIIANKRLYCPTYNELNDPYEGEFYNMTGAAIAGLGIAGITYAGNYSGNWQILGTNDSRICSFSKSYKDVRMWSFYADSHKGICIAIDLDDYSEDDLRVIDYEVGIKTVSKSDISERTIRNILSRKSKQWDYEQEIRLFSKEMFHTFRGKIKRILIGSRCSQLEEDMIRKIADDTEICRVLITPDHEIVKMI